MSNILFSGANTGIGISPSYKLDVAGTTQIRGATGTNPATVILNPSGAGFVSQIESLSSGAFTLNMSHNSVLGISINSSGQVGVGTSAQANILQVGGAGRLRISNGDTDYSLIGTSDTDGSTNTRVVVSGNTRGGGLAGRVDYVATASGSHYWFSGGVTQRMELNSSGNLAIGTAAGTVQKFRVNTSGSTIYYANQFDGTLTQNDSGADGGSQIGVFSGNTCAPTASCFLTAGHYIQSSMYAASTKSITHAAQLWINPIYSNASNLGTIFTAYGIRVDTGPAHAGTVNNGYGLYVSRPGYGTNKYTAYLDPVVGIGTTPGADRILAIAGDIRLAATSNYGVVLAPSMGATSGTANECYALYVAPLFNSNVGTVSNGYGMRILDGGTAGTVTNGYSLYVQRPLYGTTKYTAYFDTGVGIAALNNGATYALLVSGTAGLISGTAWTNASDARIKKNILPLTSALDTMDRLNPCKFQYVDEYLNDHPSLDRSRHYYGFIADEVEQVIPECVKVDSGSRCYNGAMITKKELEKKLKAEGVENPEVPDPEPCEGFENLRQLDIHNITILSFAAIKELNEKNKILEDSNKQLTIIVESLLARVAALEARE